MEEADASTDRPTVIFAYTIKGWRLPIAGAPHNHSKLLSAEEMSTLAEELFIPLHDEWAVFDPESELGALCQRVARCLYSDPDRQPAGLSAQEVPESVPIRT